MVVEIINLLAGIAIILILIKWAIDNRSIFDDTKVLIIYLTPPVAVFGLAIGMGYTNIQALLLLSVVAIGSAFTYSMRERAPFQDP